MDNVSNIRGASPVSAEISKALIDMDVAIAQAIDKAKLAGLPQGFIVSTLHGHAHAQTHIMVTA